MRAMHTPAVVVCGREHLEADRLQIGNRDLYRQIMVRKNKAKNPSMVHCQRLQEPRSRHRRRVCLHFQPLIASWRRIGPITSGPASTCTAPSTTTAPWTHGTTALSCCNEIGDEFEDSVKHPTSTKRAGSLPDPWRPIAPHTLSSCPLRFTRRYPLLRF